jgi:chromosome segregation ATPase
MPQTLSLRYGKRKQWQARYLIVEQLCQDVSFSATISQLKGENAILLQQLHECKENMATELKYRQVLEGEVKQLSSAQEQLQEQIRQYAATAAFFKSSVSKYFTGLSKVLPMLDELRTGLSLDISN